MTESRTWRPNRLSPREWEIIDLLEIGYSDLEIADKLVITEGTVGGHLNNIYRKLNVNRRKLAVAAARTIEVKMTQGDPVW